MDGYDNASGFRRLGLAVDYIPTMDGMAVIGGGAKPSLARGEVEHSAPVPILRWMGSKRRSAPQIVKAIGQVRGRYFEPFAGSAAVFFALGPPLAQISDLNDDLIGALEVLRDDPIDLHTAVASMRTDESSYYQYRSESQRASKPFDRARYFVYLNRYCFNGIYRTNRLNHFNVPYGSATGALPTLESFLGCARALAGSDLCVMDYATAVKTSKEGDVVYFDPPYPAARPLYGEYGYGTFASSDLVSLENVALNLAESGVRVAVTISLEASGQLPRLAAWHALGHELSYSVSASSGRRRKAREVTVVSWEPDNESAGGD